MVADLLRLWTPQDGAWSVGTDVEVLGLRFLEPGLLESVRSSLDTALGPLDVLYPRMVALVLRGENLYMRVQRAFTVEANAPPLRRGEAAYTPTPATALRVFQVLFCGLRDVVVEPAVSVDALGSLSRFNAPSLDRAVLFPADVSSAKSVVICSTRALTRLLGVLSAQDFRLRSVDIVPSVPANLVNAVFKHEVGTGALTASDRARFNDLLARPVVLVAVERIQAVKRLLQLAGPPDPAVSGPQGAIGLRAFGRSLIDNDLRVPHSGAAAEEWASMWPTNAESRAGAAGESGAVVRGIGIADIGRIRDMLRAIDTAQLRLVGLRVAVDGDGWSAAVAVGGPAHSLRLHCPADAVVTDLAEPTPELAAVQLIPVA
jgi:hypothetical protein